MAADSLDIPGLLLIEPKVFADSRGYFLETWNAARYEALGITTPMRQDNLSFSKQGVVRGLHFQHPHGQGKLISVLVGEILDIAVDVRVGSPTFGRWKGVRLSGENHRQFYIPPGFAHGFSVLSLTALVAYKCTELYQPACETTIIWNDPALAIDWLVREPVLSPKDAAAAPLAEIARERLPRFED